MAEAKLTDLIHNSQPRRRLTKMGILIMAGLALLVWSLILEPGTELGRLIPLLLIWAILVSLLLATFISTIRRQGLTKWSRQASDFCLMEEWSQAIEPLQRLLAKPVPSAQIRYQGLLELAGAAEHTGQLEEASEIYQAIAQEQPRGLLGKLAMVGKAIVLLKLDQLADADNIIRQLEVGSQTQRIASAGSLNALVMLARLYQQIKTGHYLESLAEESKKCELAREGLSTKAAYVYALLGLAYNRRAKLIGSASESALEDRGKAKVYWQRATMLLRAENLVRKLPELAELEGSYASSVGLPGASENEEQ